MKQTLLCIYMMMHPAVRLNISGCLCFIHQDLKAQQDLLKTHNLYSLLLHLGASPALVQGQGREQKQGQGQGQCKGKG